MIGPEEPFSKKKILNAVRAPWHCRAARRANGKGGSVSIAATNGFWDQAGKNGKISPTSVVSMMNMFISS
ncbi:MAG: hypothetical protein Q7S67_01280 [Telluria sp.]|nr:hypothetical protein [Telluria sp.]